MDDKTKNELLQTIGQRLAARRRELGLTPHRVGMRVGATGGQVTRWEQGGSPNLYFTLRLCEVLEMSPNELLYGRNGKSRSVSASSSGS